MIYICWTTISSYLSDMSRMYLYIPPPTYSGLPLSCFPFPPAFLMVLQQSFIITSLLACKPKYMSTCRCTSSPLPVSQYISICVYLNVSDYMYAYLHTHSGRTNQWVYVAVYLTLISYIACLAYQQLCKLHLQDILFVLSINLSYINLC